MTAPSLDCPGSPYVTFDITRPMVGRRPKPPEQRMGGSNLDGMTQRLATAARELEAIRPAVEAFDAIRRHLLELSEEVCRLRAAEYPPEPEPEPVQIPQDAPRPGTCGEWMPRTAAFCGRRPGHRWEHRSTWVMEATAERRRAARGGLR